MRSQKKTAWEMTHRVGASRIDRRVRILIIALIHERMGHRKISYSDQIKEIPLVIHLS
jgi:hypothetical protein